MWLGVGSQQSREPDESRPGRRSRSGGRAGKVSFRREAAYPGRGRPGSGRDGRRWGLESPGWGGEGGGDLWGVRARHRPCWRSLPGVLESLSLKVTNLVSRAVLKEARPHLQVFQEGAGRGWL